MDVILYLPPSQIAQIVPLLQFGISIREVMRRFTGSRTTAPLCEKEWEEYCQSPIKWPPAGYWSASSDVVPSDMYHRCGLTPIS